MVIWCDLQACRVTLGLFPGLLQEGLSGHVTSLADIRGRSQPLLQKPCIGAVQQPQVT